MTSDSGDLAYPLPLLSGGCLREGSPSLWSSWGPPNATCGFGVQRGQVSERTGQADSSSLRLKPRLSDSLRDLCVSHVEIVVFYRVFG